MQLGLIQLVHEDSHPSPPGHPENAARMQRALDYVCASDMAGDLLEIKPKGIDSTTSISGVHDKKYIDRLRNVSVSEWGYLDSDTYISPRSFSAAWETASAAAEAIDLIISGEVKRIHLAGRPPGHHAERDHGMGFCLINNTAVAAEHACRKHGLHRIAIVDWDVHHGNGTQHIFYERDDVYYISMHHYPFYPGSGATAERGSGKGTGFTLNIPLPGGSGDDIYLEAFENRIIPELESYQPELVIIGSGFDAHNRDPLGGMELSEEAFGKMTALLVKVADRYSSGRILSIFEGGYDPEGNARSLYYHLRELEKD